MIIFEVIFWIIAIHQLLFWLYVWQIKEYRWDRFWDGLSSDWMMLFRQYDLRVWLRAKVTKRIMVSMFFGVVLMYLSHYWWLVVCVLLISVLVLGLNPIFGVEKRRIVARAKRKMESFKGKVVGITGSYGKSSTKELLVEVLKKKYKVAFTRENRNSEIGVAMEVLGWKGDEEIAVVEMGAYKRGEIKAICEMVRPRIGILTGIGSQHLSLFGSLENIKKAKYELVDFLAKKGKSFIAEIDFKSEEAKEVELKKEGVKFKYGGEVFEVKILGKRQIRNIIGVIKTAEYLGMTKKEIAKALGEIEENKFWPKKYEVNEELAVIDNSYNASRESFLSLIEYLESWKGYRKMIVTPGLIELGDKSEEVHIEIGKSLKNIDKVIVTKKRYFEELNVYGQVSVVSKVEEIREIINEERKKGKLVVAFKSRVARSLIDSIIANEF